MPNATLTRRQVGSPYPMLGTDQSGTKNATIADNASLSGAAGLDTSVAYWVYFNAVSANMNCVNKGNAAPQFEWLSWYQTGTGFKYQVSANGTATTTATATNFGVAVINTWNFVAATYDGTNISISVNAGTANTAAFSTDVFNGTDPFTLGRGDAGLTNMNGRLDCVGFWKAARGTGGALTAAQIAALYNNGVGMAYRDLSPSLKTGLVSWWNLDGDLNDSHGTNHLTNNNSLTFAAGKR